MENSGWHRRSFMAGIAGGSASLLCGSSALAQGAALRDVLTKGLGEDLLDLIPGKAGSYAKTIALIVSMEKRADQRGLPLSPLSFNQDKLAAAPVVQGSLYQSAMPRLVSLIDRSEGGDTGLSDEAGEVLADVNATQRETPEALKPDAKQVEPQAAPPPAAPIPLSRRRDFPNLREEYARLFEGLTVRDEHQETANWYLAMMQKARPRYEAVGNSVGVPWHFIAATHALEASFNFRAHLHNGDFPLSARTRQVPSGRPTVWLPPADWESSAKDALRLLGFTGQKDWSLERTLYRLEAYNGFGYRRLGVPTPYLWSFSNQYERGKFVSDGTFNARARSQQCGAAVMLKLLTNAGAVSWS